MKKLDFVLDDFTRVIYSSKEMEDLWKPRITLISNRVRQLEIETVANFRRRAALVSLSAEELRDNADELSMGRICTVPLGLVPETGMYSSNTQEYKSGPFQFRTLICDPEILPEFYEAWSSVNNHVMGEFLGYPKCCIDFFGKNWPGKVDTTFEMDWSKADNYSIWCNVLLRYLGCRIVFHLPCSMSCDATDRLGSKYFQMFYGTYPKEAKWLEELLSMPLTWSALHGVAEITTPIFKIATRTDAWSDEVIKTLNGNHWKVKEPKEESYPRINTWSANGFNNKQAMKDAHEGVILALGGQYENFSGRLIDLGCGNGELLSKFNEAEVRVGVELAYERFMEGVEDRSDIIFFHTPIIEFCKKIWSELFDLCIIGQNRFKEVTEDEAFTIINKIREKSSWLLITNYNFDTEPDMKLGNGFNLVSGSYNAKLFETTK